MLATPIASSMLCLSEDTELAIQGWPAASFVVISVFPPSRPSSGCLPLPVSDQFVHDIVAGHTRNLDTTVNLGPRRHKGRREGNRVRRGQGADNHAIFERFLGNSRAHFQMRLEWRRLAAT